MTSLGGHDEFQEWLYGRKYYMCIVVINLHDHSLITSYCCKRCKYAKLLTRACSMVLAGHPEKHTDTLSFSWPGQHTVSTQFSHVILTMCTYAYLWTQQ